MDQLRVFKRMFKYRKDLWYQIKHQLRYLGDSNDSNKQKHLIYRMIVTYHIIEKGLTMPTIRPGFGQEVVTRLCNICQDYLNAALDKHNVHYLHALKVLNEYIEYHVNIKHDLSMEIRKQVIQLQAITGVTESSRQDTHSREEYFLHDVNAVERFLVDRRTIRNYLSTEISREALETCVKIAQCSPSSCNRQPIHVYAVSDEELKRRMLSLQNGNRGFGHLAPTILVITSDLNAMMGFNEKNDGYINAGLFAMNLVNALRLHQIGSCILNWSVMQDTDRKMKHELGIDDNEMIGMLITIGYVPEVFRTALSPKNKIEDVLKFVR